MKHRALAWLSHRVWRSVLLPLAVLGAVAAIHLSLVAGWGPPGIGVLLVTIVVLATLAGGWVPGVIGAGVVIGYLAAFHDERVPAWLEARIEHWEIQLGVVTLMMVGVVEGLKRHLTSQVRRDAARVEATAAARRFERLIHGLEAVIWEADPFTRNTSFVSDQAEKILGYPRRRWLEGGAEFFLGLIHPDDRGWVARVCRQATEQGKDHELEFRVHTATGEVRWVRELVHVARDASGRPHRSVGLMIDITAHKHAQAEAARLNRDLNRRVQELQTLLDMLPVGVATSDSPDCTRIRVNPAAARLLHIAVTDNAALNAPRADALPFRVLQDGRELSFEALPMRVAAREGVVVRDTEVELVFNDGSTTTLRVSASPLFDEEQRVRGCVAAFVDVTEQHHQQQALRELADTLERRVAERTAEAEQRATQLRALASELSQAEQRERRRLGQLLHDHLQQLLVAAKMQMCLLRGHAPDEALRTSLDQVEDLLHQSIEASRSLTVELSPPVLYDAGLVAGLQWVSRWKQEKYGLTVHVDADEDAEPASEALRVLLFQAVRELLFNVVKHAQVDEAWVTMTREGDDWMRIVVEDHGAGVDRRTLTAAEPAGGFGLFSIQERLEMLGGMLTFDSAPGKGTRVTLRAPRRQRTARAVEPTDALEPTPPAQEFGDHGTPRPRRKPGVLRLMLADDHKIVREGIAGLLQEQPDMEIVGEAADGEMAVKLARHLRPDVVIMDINMPRLNGVEATRRLTRELPEIRVIGLSLYEQADMATAMRDAGAVAYLTKDGPSDKLISTIRRCAAARPTGTRDTSTV